jgi:PhnB protein
MAVVLNPYLSFKGNAREAMEFYHSVFGGKLDISTYGESGMPAEAGEGDKIMHAQLESEDGLTLMGSDAPASVDHKLGTNVSISLSGQDEEKLTGYYNQLSAGGNVHEPLAKAPWGDTFGMFADKFGVEWMVNITARQS